MKDWGIRLIFGGDAAGANAASRSAEQGVRGFGNTVRREFAAIRGAASSLQGKLAALGAGIGGIMVVKQSARLDKSLTQIGQTAGESGTKVVGLRKDLFRMAQETGQEVEDLKDGFNSAVQSGLNFREALPTIGAVNKAMAVTGAQAQQLTSGLTVASTAFHFDLAQPGMALGLLDRMIVAGRLGNAELQNLSDIFSRVGVNAARAGMSFDKTLAFIEALSLLERQPERLGTLADSTLRAFTNLKYLAKAQQGTGVKFFDEKGGRRDPIAVLTDLKKKYDSFKTAKEKEIFMFKGFGEADMDTVKGLQAILSGDMLTKMGQFTKEIQGGRGTINKDLPAAIMNAVDQTGRLKAKLREAADAFIKPFNQGIAVGIRKLVDKKENGGYDLSGGQLVGMGAGALLTGYLGYRFGGKAGRAILGRLGGNAAGIAEGKMVEAATGVTPVYVVNMPGGFGGGTAAGQPGGKISGAPVPGGLIAKYLPLLAPYAPAMATGSVLTATAGAMVGHEINRQTMGDDKYIELLREKGITHRGRDAMAAMQNTINMTLNIDANGRSVVTSDNMNTSVNLKRTGFGP